MNFQERLEAAMTHVQATPKSLASALGVSVQAVSQVLSGSTRALTAENCVKAALYLGVDIVWLATGQGEMSPKKAEPDMSLSPQERDLIIALRVLPDSERTQLIASVMEKAKHQLEHLTALIERNPAPKSTVVPLRR